MLMDVHGIITCDLVYRVAVSLEHSIHVVAARPREDGGPADLVSVQMQDRQHCAVARRIEEAGALPRPLQRRRFGLAVANRRHDDQIRIVEGRAERVRQHVSKLAAFMNRARRGRANVTRNAAGRRELSEQPAQSGHVTRDVRIDLRVRALEVDIGDDRRSAVSGTGEEDACRRRARRSVDSGERRGG